MNSDIFHIIYSLAGQNKVLDAVIIFCASYLIYVLFALLAGLVIWLAIKRRWGAIVYTGLHLIMAFTVARGLSHLHESNRPFVDNHFTPLVQHVADQSFPSDHMAAAVAIALSIMLFMRYKLIGSIALVIALTVGIARIAAGVHYPLDIAGSIVAAVVAAVIVIIIRSGMKPPKQSVKFKRPDRS